MIIYKSLFIFFQILTLFINNSTNTKLYNTENTLATQFYDCIYYTNRTANNNETTPYCIRTNENVLLNRSFKQNTCGNFGKQWNFKSLKEINISQDEVLTWNSSIEMADRYAAYLTTGNEQFDDDKICNCSSNTFGKFCEYEFLTMNTFEQTIQYQFYLKMKYRNGSQLWGNITCYTTLNNCYYGLRCLTWQNICDRQQQCMDGIDEEHCEELEYNECEENEYRCQDGSCISEQYWLDGQYDCSDKSDEQSIENYFLHEYLCPLTSSHFICDETTDRNSLFACSDGEFRLNDLTIINTCYNYRNLMFFCEYPSYDEKTNKRTLWTLENGHCVEKDIIQKSLSDMNELEKCVFYLKCKLTNNTTIHCDNVTHLFYSLCQNKTIKYPLQPVFKPYVQAVYQLSQVQLRSRPTYASFNGSMKCLGYQGLFSSNITSMIWVEFEINHEQDIYFCQYSDKKDPFGPQIDKNCWNDTRQSYLCSDNLQCISKHRVRDGYMDCIDNTEEDETDTQRYYIKNKHRFNCFEETSISLFVSAIGDEYMHCYTGSDEYITQLKWNLFDRKCTTPDSFECNTLKTYIQSRSLLSKDKILLFRQYCDTLWDLSRGFDESLCNQWKCSEDQYQCLSGHCISMKRVFLATYADWNCPDASDNIGLLQITQLSEHNMKLINSSRLQQLKDELIRITFINGFAPFTAYCNISKEYGCILANVKDPLNFIMNRPCINLTQIGDGIIDCYGGLDERNLLSCGNNISDQRGYDFHCNDQECIPYQHHCEKRCSNNADDLLCNQFPTLFNSCSEYPTGEVFCRTYFPPDCDPFKKRIYYCDPNRLGTIDRSKPYRQKIWEKQNTWIHLPEYPIWKDILPYQYDSLAQDETSNIYSNISDEQENNGEEGWICGRGVAVKNHQMNKIECFCPPSLHGKSCEYFNDRITIITSLNNIPSELIEGQSNTMKILALFLSNDEIIDHYIFHLPLILSKKLNKKFRFNLIYQRPKLLSNVYTIQFKAYYLTLNSSIKFLGIWEYSIKFPFLPSYRFAQVLKFEKESKLINDEHICKKANPCLYNSTCHPIINKINSTSSYYCHCNNQTFGKQCQNILQSTISFNCSKNSLLYRFSSLKSICLCPIERYGITCHLNHTCINNNPCGNDRGKCYINPDNITRDYICICDKKYFGDHCQLNSSMVQINFTNLSFVKIPSNYILSTIIQLCDLHNETLDLIIQEKHVYQGLPSLITQIYHNNYYLPIIGLIKFYHKKDLTNDYIANLKETDYFILYITSSNVSRMNLTLEINITNYCPHTQLIFNKNISNILYLSQFLISNETDLNNKSNISTRIFEYHLLCDEPYSLICFYDDIYFCFCDKNHRAEGSRYNSSLDKCSQQCHADGQCIHGDLDNQKDFICLCPQCYYGSICQHNTKLFSFTLETLLYYDLDSSSILIQNLFFALFLLIPTGLFIIGAMNNICGYVTFNRPKPLLVGIGHYLRTNSIINQLTLFILVLKLLHLVLSIRGYIINQLINKILCKVLSYLLVCLSRISYWLMGMVAIERVYVTWFIKGVWLKSPKTAKYIIVTIIIGIIGFDVHELIYYQTIEDPKSLNMINSTLCITSYPSSITIYNQVNIILNYILPFLINLFSTITLIILITRNRITITKKQHDQSTSKINTRFTFRAYINLLLENKDLILAPSVTMLPQIFALPQFILSFSLVCQEFKVHWQRYLLIISYFITYLPQVISYKLYITPSSFYTEEFHATKLNQKISKWRSYLRRK